MSPIKAYLKSKQISSFRIFFYSLSIQVLQCDIMPVDAGKSAGIDEQHGE